MKVVLSGYYGFDNVGDEAILLSIISALRQQNPAIELTVLSNQPEKTAETYGVNAVNRWKLKEVAAAIRESDGVISGGGSLLQDETGNRSVLYYSAIMWIAKFFRKRLFIYAQGIGPLHEKQSKRIVRFSVAKGNYITVRDDDSKALLKQIGVKKPIHVVPDPVLGIDVTEAMKEPRLIDGRYVAVSVRDWPTEHNYKEKLARSLDDIARAGYAIVFIPMHGKDDEQSSAETIAYMEEKAIVAPHDGSIMQKIAWISQSDLLIGIRLHALIFAAVTDTPFIALSYDPKIDSFTTMCNQPLFAHVNDDWEKDALTALIRNQLSHREKAVEEMKQYAERAKKEARQTAEAVIKMIERPNF